MESLKLQEFLDIGTVIKTKHCSSCSWVTNVVYSISDDYIEIDLGLEKDYIQNVIMIGDTIKCKYASEDYEFILVGWITRINADFPQRIVIKVHEMVKFENKRDSFRFDVYLCAIIKRSYSEEKGIFALLTNISHTGAAFVVNEELDIQFSISNKKENEAIYYFEIYVSPERQINFQGKIRRKSEAERGKEYGVKITDIDIKSEKVLSELLEELEKKDKEFYNKRSSFWSQHSKYNKDEENK